MQQCGDDDGMGGVVARASRDQSQYGLLSVTHQACKKEGGGGGRKEGRKEGRGIRGNYERGVDGGGGGRINDMWVR